MSETTGCVIGGKPHSAAVGYLCRGHFERLSAMLRDVEDQAAMLDAVPSMQQQAGSGGGSLASERAPARLEVLAYLDPQTRRHIPDVEPRYAPPPPKAIGPWCLFCDHETCTAWRAGRRRDLHDDEHDAGSSELMSVLAVLGGWARVVREDRALAWPESVTVTSERDTLSRNLDWLAEQPFIDEAYAAVRDLVDGLRALNHTQPERSAGTCFLLTDTGVCGGRIWRRDSKYVAWRVGVDRCELAPVEVPDGPAYCEQCGQEWDGADLDRLNLILEQQKREAARPRTEDGRKMLTAAEIQARTGLKPIAFRVRVHRQGIASVDGHYDPEDFTGNRQMSA